MRIAIIGAGFAGLSCAWHLSQNPLAEITIFDAIGIGGGASGIAAGLLHPFGGVRARLNTKGYEGMASSKKLFKIASESIGQPVATQTGLFRLPTTPEQAEQFRQNTLNHPQNNFQPFINNEALYIPDAWTVDCPLYLLGLYKACEQQKVKLIQQNISSLGELDNFDKIVLAAGAASKLFPECAHLPLKILKGQILGIDIPPEIQNQKTPWTGSCYVVPQQEKGLCIIGATFERDYASAEPDRNLAEKELLIPLIEEIPCFANAKVQFCKAGLRAMTPSYYPHCQRISDKCWIAAGLGSKGLLYHGLLGEELAFALFNT